MLHEDVIGHLYASRNSLKRGFRYVALVGKSPIVIPHESNHSSGIETAHYYRYQIRNNVAWQWWHAANDWQFSHIILVAAVVVNLWRRCAGSRQAVLPSVTESFFGCLVGWLVDGKFV